MGIFEIIAGPVFGIINKLIPDPAMKAQMQQKAMEMAQAGEFKELDAQLQRDLAQIAVNQTEAASGDLFKGGWRPSVGWTCSAGLAIQFIVAPLASWGAALAGHPITFPALDTATLLTLLGGLLGLGTLRTTEKVKGVA
jgi:hypothetical protein